MYTKSGLVFAKTDQIGDLPDFNHFWMEMPQRAACAPQNKIA